MLKTLDTRNPPDALIIFDRFVVDESLPKFQKELEADEDEVRKESDSGIWTSTPGFFTINDNLGEVGTINNLPEAKKTPWIRFRIWWAKLRAGKPPAPEPPKPIQLVFEQVLTDLDELEVWEDRDDKLHKMMEQADKTGQRSLREKLEAEKGLRQTENALFAAGRKRLITESQLLKFVWGCEKGLCLDWVRHFTRPIPDEVVAEKVKCDELGVFDNYVVLHYDPLNNAAEMTEAEKDEEMARRRDPILFGVFRGSRKLYFVRDWKDDLCDLTLQEIVDKLGEPLEMT